MNKFRYMGVISTLTWFWVIASVSAQDILKTDTQDFEVIKRGAFGLCGNLKVLCGSVFAEGNTSDDLNEVKIDGKTTVEKALEKVTQENPRYQWSVEDGIINITPKNGYRHLKNGKDSLDTIIEDFTMNDVTSCESSYILCKAAGLNCIPREIAGIRQLCNKISLKLNKVTVRAALNEIVKADGMASWKLEYYGKDKRPIIDVNCWRPGSILIKGDSILPGEKLEQRQPPVKVMTTKADRSITDAHWYQVSFVIIALLIPCFILRAFRQASFAGSDSRIFFLVCLILLPAIVFLSRSLNLYVWDNLNYHNNFLFDLLLLTIITCLSAGVGWAAVGIRSIVAKKKPHP